jgi:hypothetical protein
MSENAQDDSLKRMDLSKSDYIKILNYYKLRIPLGSSSKTLKNRAENIISEKMCRCIKKVGTDNEPRAIGICTKTVINRKGYRRGKFSCSSTFSAKLNKSGAKSRAKSGAKRTTLGRKVVESGETRGSKKGRYITLSKLPSVVRNKTARRR